jgi:uncharacterized protein (DUF58 family)
MSAPAEPRRGLVRALATYDFFPAFSAKARKALYNPLGVLALAALAALLCGLFLHVQGLALFGGACAVIALGVVWPWVTARAVCGELAFDRPRATEGERVEVRLAIRNRLPFAAWGLAVRGGFGARADDVVVGVASAPARREVACAWAFEPPARGAYPVGAPRLTTGFPFGLWNAGRALAVPAPLLVWPRTLPVGPIPPVSGDDQVEGTVSRNRVGSVGDVVGVRPYRRGDSPRRIHWGQSAKHDRLIVCELQSNARPVIQIVLDADPAVHRGTGASGSREWAIRVAASFAKGWLEAGARVGLAWAGGAVPPASGAAQVAKVLDALAALPDDTAVPLPAVLAAPACAAFRDGLQVIVTTNHGHAHPECAACAAAHQRWVVLTAGGFADTVDVAAACGACAEPWLVIESADGAPEKLRGGWREARHGS